MPYGIGISDLIPAAKVGSRFRPCLEHLTNASRLTRRDWWSRRGRVDPSASNVTEP